MKTYKHWISDGTSDIPIEDMELCRRWYATIMIEGANSQVTEYELRCRRSLTLLDMLKEITETLRYYQDDATVDVGFHIQETPPNQMSGNELAACYAQLQHYLKLVETPVLPINGPFKLKMPALPPSGNFSTSDLEEMKSRLHMDCQFTLPDKQSCGG